MEELFARSGRLVPEEEWKSMVVSLRSRAEAAGIVHDKEKCVSLVADSVVQAVRARIPNRRFGIMFSGGVDSSLIALLCRRFGGDFACYTAGIEGSRDLAAARLAAGMLDVELKDRVFSLDEVQSIVDRIMPVLPVRDVVSVGVASVAYAACSMANEDGIPVLFSGLGSEEIFAGYQRHGLASDVNEECWNGLLGMWRRDLARDSALAGFLNVSFMTPFLDESLIVSSMRVPGRFKIAGDGRKVILREAAIRLGLPEKIAFRRKLAAQYGSGFDAALSLLARRRGLKFKRELISPAESH